MAAIRTVAILAAVALCGGCGSTPEGAAAPPGPAAAPAADGWISLFDGATLGQWKSLEKQGYGPVAVKDGAIILDLYSPMTAITYTGEFPRDSYEVSLEASRLEGSDFFCGMTFPVGNDPCTLIVGGWGGSVVGLSNVDSYAADGNETTKYISFENGKWYRIRLRVTPAAIQAWLDAEQLFELEREGKTFSIWPQQEPVKPFGVATWYTKAGLRDLKYRKL